MSENPVLNSTLPLVINAKHVQLNKKKIEDVAFQWMNADFELPDWTWEPQPDADTFTLIDYYMIANSLNFAFKEFKEGGEKFTASIDGKDYRGSLGLWACLNRAYDEGLPITTGGYLARLTRDELAHIFRGNIEIPMLDERLAILNQIGNKLEFDYGDRFSNFVEQHKARLFDHGEGLVERLVEEFPSYDDRGEFNKESEYGNEAIFWKRAQLTVGMLRGRLGEGYFPEAEIPLLTVFADYQLPRVLRGLDCIEYDDELAYKVDNEIPLEAGSREELEIRAATIHAADCLIAYINGYRRGTDKPLIAGPHMDAHLFIKKRKLSGLKPHHLCETTAY